MSAYNFYILSDIGGRSENQDYVLTQETPFGFVMIVCDGMGGANGGRLASETAAKTIAEVFNQHVLTSYDDERVYFLTLMETAMETANNKVYELSQSQPELQGMGTTACIALLRGNKAYLGHVGDSRIYHFSGKQFRHSEDHSRVFEMYKNDILSKEQARVHPESNIITRALGIRSSVAGSYEEVSVNVGNRLVLCTDGIWGVFPEEKLIKKFNSKASLEQISKGIIAEINEKYNAEGKRHDKRHSAKIQRPDNWPALDCGDRHDFIARRGDLYVPHRNLLDVSHS